MSLENNHIDKRDFDENRALLFDDDDDGRPCTPNRLDGDEEGFLGTVAQGILDRDRKKMRKEVLRYVSFVCAVLSCLCAGSITAFSLYGHLFLSRLHYTQLQVNTVSIAAELSMYLPVPIFGYLCDRYGPSPLSLFSGSLFACGYLLAAFTYQHGPHSEGGWPFSFMVIAFLGVGAGTSSMYLSAVATCAKNFGRGRHKGLVLAIPIAAFGLSGMWQSQLGSNILYETTPEGEKGDVDVFRYFLFLAILLLVIGVVGVFGLRIIGEDELIVEELERSGLLEDSPFYRRGTARTYGAIARSSRSSSVSSINSSLSSSSSSVRRAAKTFLLNHATLEFLNDPTMWLLAAGFFLITGPGEAFINNIGTIIDSLYPSNEQNPTTAATHVSIIALTSTIARILVGTLSDTFAPSQDPRLDFANPRKITIPRPLWLIFSTVLLSIGLLLLALGIPTNNAKALIPTSTFIGAGYGAAFALTPILISCVWGVENFATNWGIVAMMPAAGASIWGVLYSISYQRALDNGHGEDNGICYGTTCYAPAFWGMTAGVWIAIGLFTLAWKGKTGWFRRGISI